MARLALALFGLALLLVLLAWFQVIPGGWRLRNLIEDPARRERRLLLDHRAERLAAFRRESTPIAPGTVLFIGSSTIERFPLSDCFPGKGLLNRGIGGESAELMLARLDESLPAGRERLAAAVVYAGTIDFRKERVDAAEASRRLARLVDALRDRVRADLPVLLLGPLPGNEDDDRYRGAGLLELEGAYRRLATERGLDFLPLARAPFRAADGGLEPRLAVDRWHLDAAGYRLLAELIRTEGGDVGRLLGP